MNATITAMHYCVPRKRLTNQELGERFGEKALKSIIKMAGIQERRVVSEGQTASDLAYVAASRLIEDRGVDRQAIDLIIFASQTGDYQIPATAAVLHHRLRLSQRCGAFDINLGCTSFPYSLSVASGMVSSGIVSKALVLNADAITTVIHPRDRGLVPLHGDAAVATLVEPATSGGGIVGFLLGTDGSGYKHLIIPASGARVPRTEETRRETEEEPGVVRTQEHLYMNGPAVFHFSVYKVPEVIKEALQRFHLSMENIDLVLLHQANKTMIDLVYRALEVPPEKRFYFMETVGNASGASTPMLLAEAWRQGRVKPGQRLLVASFGVGLSWGVFIIEWPGNVGPAVQASVEASVEESTCDFETAQS